jgi:hypothetical protein
MTRLFGLFSRFTIRQSVVKLPRVPKFAKRCFFLAAGFLVELPHPLLWQQCFQGQAFRRRSCNSFKPDASVGGHCLLRKLASPGAVGTHSRNESSTHAAVPFFFLLPRQ